MTLRLTEAVRFGSLVGLWLIITAIAAEAQFPGPMPRYQQRRQNIQQQMEALKLKTAGSVETVGQGWIQITSNAGEGWQLFLSANTQVELRGKAKPEFLAPGQFISFVATVDKRQPKLEETVAKLTIFTPDEEHTLGAFPAGLATPNPLEAGAPQEQEDPGQEPGLSLPQPKAKARRGPAPVSETLEIAGRITRIRNGEITVAIPNYKSALRFELAEEPEIDVHVWGTGLYAWARKGDKVQVEGFKAPDQAMQGAPVDVRRAQADYLSIELAEPLAPEAGKRAVRRGAAGRAKGQSAEEPGESAPAAEAPAE